MGDDTASSAQSPVVEFEFTVRRGNDTVTEVIEVDLYEVEDLLQQAMRGTLQDVSSRTIEEEIRHRSRP